MEDSGPAGDGGILRDVPGLDTGAIDASGSDTGALDAPVACTPTPGAAMTGAYCDSLELAVFTHDDAPPELRLYGRLVPDGPSGACSVVDEVDVLEGSLLRGTLPGAGALGTSAEPLLAAGAALAEVTARCETDARFGGFGLVVRGHVDGGTFEARCADAEGGSRWPPALRVTCHHNVEHRPRYTSAVVMIADAYAYTTVDMAIEHSPGASLTSVDGTVRVIPAIAFGAMPVPPFDSTGWMGSASEGFGTPLLSQLQMRRSDAAFGTELCPVAMPTGTSPPVFLVRISGTGERGAFSTEGLATYCNTVSPL